MVTRKANNQTKHIRFFQRHWRHFDFESRRFQNLARALSPAYLRLGGIAANLAIFEENCESDENESDNVTE